MPAKRRRYKAVRKFQSSFFGVERGGIKVRGAVLARRLRLVLGQRVGLGRGIGRGGEIAILEVWAQVLEV